MNLLIPITLACRLVVAGAQSGCFTHSAKPTKDDSHASRQLLRQPHREGTSKLSKAFYEKLDFKQVAGKLEQNWVVTPERHHRRSVCSRACSRRNT